MADLPLSASGNEEKSVSRANSFTNKFLRTSSSPKTMRKSSSNPITKLLFRRKSSKKRAENEGEDSSTSVADGDDNEEEDAPSVVEEVKEVVESAIDHLLHRDHKEHTSTELTNDAAISIQSRDVSSTETKENKPSLLDKFKEEVEVAGQSADHLVDKFKVGLGKAKEGVVETIADIISDNKKPIVEEVKAPILAKTVQEEVVAPIVNTIKDDTKKAETGHEEISRELKGESKKEDGCVSSLAQGLEKLCTPWNSKKEV